MRTLSRNMPVPPVPRTVIGTYAALGCVGAGAVAVLLSLFIFPEAWMVFGGLVLVGTVVHLRQKHHLRRLAAGRPGEDLCTFVRGFDRRSVDPWVLRAVYEELQPYCSFKGGCVPLRPDDALEELLGIDGEGLDDLALDMARRAWRSMDHPERNPFHARVRTVRDLVHFLDSQPRLQPS